jgi:hypothetical protein
MLGARCTLPRRLDELLLPTIERRRAEDKKLFSELTQHLPICRSTKYRRSAAAYDVQARGPNRESVLGRMKWLTHERFQRH